MAAKLECPECQGGVDADDVQCEHCGLLLRPEPASGEHVVPESAPGQGELPPTLRLRTRPQEPPRAPSPSAPAQQDMATVRFTVFMDAQTVPHVRAGVDLGQCPLQPFEAHVASFVDGVLSVPELARAARLPEIEVKVVLKLLMERGVVELRRVPASSAQRHPSDELPVLDGWEFLEPEPVALGEEPPSN